MQLTVEFHGTLRDAADGSSVTRQFGDDQTLGAVLEALADDYESLGPLVFDSDGRIRSNVAVAVNGDPVTGEPRRDRQLSDGDRLMLAPGLAGGGGHR